MAKWMYFRMSGGEYCDDIFGAVELDQEFYELLQKGQEAVAACAATFYPERPHWFGDVSHLGGWWHALSYDGMERLIGLTDENGMDRLEVGERLLLDLGPHLEGATREQEEAWYVHIEGERTTFDYRGVVFTCRQKHQDHEYWAGSWTYAELEGTNA